MHRIEIFITTKIPGHRANRTKTVDGILLDKHFQFQMSRDHKVRIVKNKRVFVPKKEVSILLYARYKPLKKSSIGI